jgi:hypothetical protein
MRKHEHIHCISGSRTIRMLDLSAPADQAPAQNCAVLWLLREGREMKLNELFNKFIYLLISCVQRVSQIANHEAS